MLKLSHSIWFCALAACVLQIALPNQVEAAGPYDPSIEWRTIRTERFAVHYPPEAKSLGVRVARMAEEELDRVGALFDFVPEGIIDIVLTDNSDYANGSATVYPKNTLRLFLTAPTELTGLAAYDDWLRLLLIHELAHLCDIDQARGLNKPMRFLFGKLIQANGFTPQFLSEGVAVYVETMLTGRGRGRSSYVSMILRMAALEGKFLDIDQAHIFFSDWPGPNAAYYYGGRFHLWLKEKHGEAGPKNLHRNNAANPFPIWYLYWPIAKATFGKSLPELWKEWREEEIDFARRVKTKVERKGITPSRAITHHGRNIGGIRYSPDGDYVVYSRTSPIDGSTVRRVNLDGSEDKHLVLLAYSPRVSFERSGDAFYFSRNAINARFNDFNDIYRYDLEKEKMTRLRPIDDKKKSLRARDPDISPDGKKIVFVQNELHQSWVSVAELVHTEEEDPNENKEKKKKKKKDAASDSEATPTRLKTRILLPPHGDRQYAAPRFSPDGKSIVVSGWVEGGYRDLFLVDAETGAMLDRLTSDKALDNNPAFSPDGRYIVYESDRTGIFNIYAYDIERKEHRQLTNVIGAALQPDVAPDGKHFIFRNASGSGFDIHEAVFAPEAAPFVSVAQTAPEVNLSLERTRAQETLTLQEGEKDESYRPWRTVAPFHDNWVMIPTLYSRGGDWTGGLTTFGTDVMQEHTWYAGVQSSVRTRFPGYSVGYLNDTLLPTLGFGWSADAERRNVRISETEVFTTNEERRVGVTSISWPIKRRHRLALSYVYDDRRYPLPGADLEQYFSRAEVGYSYGFLRRYPYSVGIEDGESFAVGARWYNQNLGSDFNELLVTLDGRSYLPNPLADNHVFAFRLASAIAFGPDFRETYSLGGTQGDSLISTTASRTYALRGFDVNADPDGFTTGTGAIIGTFEYRFPLWQIEKGIADLPVYGERLHAALFADAGNTFGDGLETDFSAYLDSLERGVRRLRMGLGAETRLDLNLGWGAPITFRLGYGSAALRGGQWAFDDYTVYLDVGSAI